MNNKDTNNHAKKILYIQNNLLEIILDIQPKKLKDSINPGENPDDTC